MMQLWQQWSTAQWDTLSEIGASKPNCLILSEHTNDPKHTQTASNNPPHSDVLVAQSSDQYEESQTMCIKPAGTLTGSCHPV